MSSAIEPTVTETEQELIATAQLALSSCNWTVGECASKWCQRYSRGRTDADFGAIVGLSGEQIYQRRRVWESYADVVDNYSKLKWSHFYVALAWDESAECLAWAEDNQATVAEMKAWHRMQNGEDLTVEAEQNDHFSEAPSQTEPELASSSRQIAPTIDDEPPTTFASMEEDGLLSHQTDGPSARDQPPPRANPADLIDKATTAIERCSRILGGDIDFDDVASAKITRLAIAIGELNSVQESKHLFARD